MGIEGARGFTSEKSGTNLDDGWSRERSGENDRDIGATSPSVRVAANDRSPHAKRTFVVAVVAFRSCPKPAIRRVAKACRESSSPIQYFGARF
jgi:hypothetical protein